MLLARAWPSMQGPALTICVLLTGCAAGRVISADTVPGIAGLDAAEARLVKIDESSNARSSFASLSPTDDGSPRLHDGMSVGHEELSEAVDLVERIAESNPKLHRSIAQNIRRTIISPVKYDFKAIIYQKSITVLVKVNLMPCDNLVNEFRIIVADCRTGIYHRSLSFAFESARLGDCEDVMDRLFDSVFRDTRNAIIPQFDPDSPAPPPHPPSDPPRRASRGNHLIYMIDQNMRGDGRCAYGMTVHFK